MTPNQERIQTYNDGVAILLKCNDLGDPGDAPDLVYTEAGKLCYETPTVRLS